MTQVAIIGGGKIGEALISGLIAKDWNPKAIHVVNRRSARGQELQEKYGVTVYTEAASAVTDVDVVFVAVKPHDTIEVLTSISDRIDNNDLDTIVVSLAAGVTLAQLEEVVSAGTPVVRVMPNTPMLIGRGMSLVSQGRFVTEEQLETVTGLLAMVGEVQILPERLMDAGTAISGSGPAYYFLLTEALVEAGVNLGLPREMATRLAEATAAGAGVMALESAKDVNQLRADVQSPGGTTIAAIRVLEEAGLRGAVFDATERCAARAKELSN